LACGLNDMCTFLLVNLINMTYLIICQIKHLVKLNKKMSTFIITTLTLDSRLRQGLVKGWAKSEAQESHFMFPGVWEYVREWTFTLPNELPLWELKFRWNTKFSKSDCKGQIPLDWRVPYIVGKFLELRCLEWACMTHLGN